MEKQISSNRTENTNFPLQGIEQKIIKQRAIEAVLWGIPGVNYYLMFEEMVRKVNGKYNQIVFWSKLLDWKNQTLTPNPDVVYLMPFFNTEKVGPMVLEIPPADDGVINGSIMNFWQAAIEDVGPGGVDKGKGGKYLILPPGYDLSKVPDGFIPMPSDTFRGYALLRSILGGSAEGEFQKALNYAKRIKFYPLSEVSNPSQTTYLDASNLIFDSKITYNIRFFEILNRVIQDEPWLERDRVMIDFLNTLGIKRGLPFNPSAGTKEILNDAILEAKEWMDLLLERFETYFKNRHWIFPVGPEFHKNVSESFHVPDSYPIDNRAMIYSLAFFSAKHAGESQFYLLTTKDRAGNALEGKNHYRVHVPPKVPVSQYWSMTVYNRETHSFIEDIDRVGRSSQSPGLQTNHDGSVDIYFGPSSPASGESNWIPTDPEGRFEVLARFYGNQKPLMDKSWVMNDLELMSEKGDKFH